MATATSDLDDIDEKFLQCPICLEQLKEPKQLTCMHCFCSECLSKLLQGSLGVIKCPECREEVAVPEDGVSGFQTDFRLKSIIEFIRLKKLADLSQMVHSPRCLKHPENIMRLCCVTCNYDPICETCAHCDHRDHRKEDISTTAQIHKVNLEEKLQLLRGYKKSIYQLQDEAKSVCKNTNSYYEKRKISLKDSYKDKGDLIEQIRKKIMLNRKNDKSEIEKRYENRVAKLDIDMEKEIKQIRDKYAVMLRKTDIKRDNLLQKIEAKSTHNLSILEQQENNISRRFQVSEKALQKCMEKAVERSLAALEHSKNIIKRYENLSATASSILTAGNDWTAVQCIPDICSAVDPLIEDMTNTLTALSGIYQSPSEDPLPVDVTAFRVSYRESIVNIQCKDIPAISSVDDMVNVPGQGIIISGQTGDGGGYSQCINIHGKVLWRDVSEYYYGFPQHDVQVFKLKAAVMCFPDAVTTLSRGNQQKSIWGVQLSQMIDRWPTKLSLQCVATDPLKNRIFAGFRDCRDIYVFNDVLKFIVTFSLPPEAKYPFALAVSVGGLLIVCDANGKGVFSTNMKGELQSTYLLPLLDSCDKWIPQSVCSDSKDDVFVLLSANEYGKVIVQYRKHGGYPIAFRHVGSEMSHVAVTQVDQEEKLILVGCKCKALLVYSTTPYSDEHDKVEEETHKDSPVTSVQQQGVQMQKTFSDEHDKVEEESHEDSPVTSVQQQGVQMQKTFSDEHDKVEEESHEDSPVTSVQQQQVQMQKPYSDEHDKVEEEP